ncbi:DUF1996 domain-containing protein [Streptomyces sp. NPDC001922]|uniref:DUF1996 domain-containing protein n=1 Tax=Streptomyces sp. NPDC001922 TaxID=3364624 RepID=UPI003683D698
MKNKGHRRSRVIGTTVAAVTALALGGGGIFLVTSNASAGSGANAAPSAQAAQRLATIDCPDVAERLSQVPERARPVVDAQLAQLDTQVANAYKRWASWGAKAGQQKVDDSVLRPLTDQRRTTMDRIVAEVDRVGKRPDWLNSMVKCTVKQESTAAQAGDGAAQNPAQGQTQAPQQGQTQAPQQGQAQAAGPRRSDFVDIRSVRPNVAKPRAGGNASVGTFRSRCGRNENKHFNPDNVIVAPGVSNGAHHMHDYVGNLDTDAFSSNEGLAAAGTTCSNGDRSTHYWPVLRLRDGQREADANAPGGGQDGNVGKILQPASVKLTFKGNPTAKVAAMPRFLRIITGDAKAFTNGPANANASWSCTGFENRQLKNKYPLCPSGSKVVRTFNFQSCWDGRNIDSANHRTHVAFARSDGSCQAGFRAIPQLVQRITYNVKPGSVFAVDSFPEQLHQPVTDHGDFINVMSGRLMRQAVSCINTGRRCG